MERLIDVTPEVHQAAEFLEIAKDFTDPKEIVREAISNSFDAGATNIEVEAYVDKSSGEEDVVVCIRDDGEGMDEERLKAFFDLSYSTRLRLDERGELEGDYIGYKGHGTKVYFNSKRIEVETLCEDAHFRAILNEPWRQLHRRQLPDVERWRGSNTEGKTGTLVKVCGYNYASRNPQKDFAHDVVKDYILWFTKFGSAEMEFGHEENKHKKLRLKGVDRDDWEPLDFGHRFPPQNYDGRALRHIDPAQPTEYYVRRLFCAERPVIGHPTVKLEFVFYIEGDKAKREYNPMLTTGKGRPPEGTYTVGQRYGLWVCRDYIPIKTFNQWVAQKTEWTKYHAFVNCQALELTANRSDLGNTPKALMEAIRETVERIFWDEIRPSRQFQDYADEAKMEEELRSAEQEKSDFTRRRRLTLRKKVAQLNGVELVEPRQEAGVYSLFLILNTLKPDLFDWRIVDYDTKTGYDALVRANDGLPLDRTRLAFLEFKKQLEREFDHSFGRLEAIICWDCNLSDEDEVEDIEGKKRKLKITSKSEDNPYTKYMLISTTEPHNIEVIVLKDYIKDKLGLEFRPRTG